MKVRVGDCRFVALLKRHRTTQIEPKTYGAILGLVAQATKTEEFRLLVIFSHQFFQSLANLISVEKDPNTQ